MNIQDNVKEYYGSTLQSSGDLKTDACCTIENTPGWLKPVLSNIHPEVSARYYGCGLLAPLALSGARILDLGSGSGRDAYALAQLTGPDGAVIGVDMTGEQLAVARGALDWHAERFGYANVEFMEGDIEDLSALDLAPGSFDVIVSNCVINLVADKGAVFRAAWNLLKPGGEFYFADVYADRRLPTELRNDPAASRRMPCRSALLERLSDAVKSRRVRRSSAGHRPPVDNQQRRTARKAGAGRVSFSNLPPLPYRRS